MGLSEKYIENFLNLLKERLKPLGKNPPTGSLRQYWKDCLQISAPLAAIMGRQDLKDSLEDEAFEHLYPKERRELLEKLERWQKAHPFAPERILEILKKELEQAEADGNKVILLCHFPVLPEESHILWNAGDLVDLVSSYSCVKAWFNGHNHAGGYAEYQGIHFITFQGMVDTEQNSFAIVTLGQDKLVINGIGREKDRELVVKP